MCKSVYVLSNLYVFFREGHMQYDIRMQVTCTLHDDAILLSSSRHLYLRNKHNMHPVHSMANIETPWSNTDDS